MPQRPSSPADRQRRLRNVQSEFLRRLESELDQLERGLSAEDRRTILHRMQGTGGTCGFPLVSELARELGGASGPEEMRVLGALREEHRRALESLTEESAGEERATDDPTDDLRRIVCVEDDPDIAELLKLCLGELGVSLEVFVDGSEAWERLSGEDPEPHLVVMDLMLPGIDGFTLLTYLRRQESTRDVPVVVLSARALDDEHKRVLATEGTTYMPKPFDIDVLERTVLEILGHE